MRKLDYFWKTNKDWWYRDKNLVPRLKEDAPPEAQESYKHYLEQKKKGYIVKQFLKINNFFSVF